MIVKFLDGLRETKAEHIPPGARLQGQVVISAWENGFNRALLLVMNHILDL